MVGGSQRLRAVGAALAVVGVFALVVPSLGLASVQADRPVSVAVADDESAALGISDESASGSTSIDGPNDQATVFELSDNLGPLDRTDLGATVVTAERSDGAPDGDPPLAAAVAGSDDPFDVVLSCEREGPAFDGNYTVTVKLTADSEDVSVTATRTTDAYVPISCGSESVTVESGGSSGPISTGGDVDIGNDADVDGAVDSGGTVTAGARAEIDGDVAADGDVETGNRAEIDGSIDSGGSVSTGHRTEVDGTVTSNGDVSVGINSTIEGSIDSGGSVTVDNRAYVDGEVTAEGGVALGSGSEVDGSIDGGGSVTLDGHVEIDGDVSAEGDVTLGSESEVDGDVESGGTVYVGCNVDVEDITADEIVSTC